MTATKPADRTIGMPEYVEKRLLAELPLERWRAYTWLDLIHVGARPGTVIPSDDDLLTRGEFLDALAQRGVSLTVSNLERWHQLYLLPRPVRRRFRGATRAVYHPRMIDQAEGVRVLLNAGYSRTQIATMLALSFESIGAWLGAWPADTNISLPWKSAISHRAPETVIEAVTRLAAAYERLTGQAGSISAARLTFLHAGRMGLSEVETIDFPIDYSVLLGSAE
jgi:hypothetical protein